jgi:GNAT superfamily N-acetyltransferase
MSTTIRQATLQDLEPLSLLFDGYRIFYEEASDLEGVNLFLKDRISNKDSDIFVALDSTGTMTGFLQLYPIFSSTRMKRFFLLNDLFVHPSYRGQGISKAMILEVQKFTKEIGSCGLLLETAKTNLIGNKLYPSVGFICDTEHNYYTWDTK